MNQIVEMVPARATIPAPANEHAALLSMIERIARDPSVPLDRLVQMLEIRDRMEMRDSKRAFDTAIAAAKAAMPVIFKNREMNAGAGRTQYRYEDMAEIAKTITPILSEHGLSYRFRTKADGNVVYVTCIISHKDGHSEENTLPGNLDTSGSKNQIQALGSALTYLQRYALKAALGLAASADDDAVSVSSPPANGSISPEQLAELIHLCDEVGADKGKFCVYMKIENLAAMPAAKFKQAVAALQAKGAKK